MPICIKNDAAYDIPVHGVPQLEVEPRKSTEEVWDGKYACDTIVSEPSNLLAKLYIDAVPLHDILRSCNYTEGEFIRVTKANEVEEELYVL